MESGREFNLPPEKPAEAEYPYASPLDSLRNAPATIQEVDEEEEDSVAPKSSKSSKKNSEKKSPGVQLLSALQNVKIALLSGNITESLKKPKYRNLFDRCWIANMSVLPLLEEAGTTHHSSSTEAGTTAAGGAASSSSSSDGKRSAVGNQSVLLSACKEEALITVETMRAQVRFSGVMKLGYRVKMQETMDKLGYETLEKNKLPRKVDLEAMKDWHARKLEAEMPECLNFRRRGTMGELDFD